MKELGVFLGDGNNRTAKVYKDDDKYLVTVKNASGVYFTSEHTRLEEAENYAEDWVLKDE